MTAYHLALQRQTVLREIQIKLDWLILATPTSEARNLMTNANIAINGASIWVDHEVDRVYKETHPNV